MFKFSSKHEESRSAAGPHYCVNFVVSIQIFIIQKNFIMCLVVRKNRVFTFDAQIFFCLTFSPIITRIKICFTHHCHEDTFLSQPQVLSGSIYIEQVCIPLFVHWALCKTLQIEIVSISAFFINCTLSRCKIDLEITRRGYENPYQLHHTTPQASQVKFWEVLLLGYATCKDGYQDPRRIT